jgi:hypothetical protein
MPFRQLSQAFTNSNRALSGTSHLEFGERLSLTVLNHPACLTEFRTCYSWQQVHLFQIPRRPSLKFACFLTLLFGILLAQCSAQQGKFDGPAELPRLYVDSALSATPSPGKTIPVRTGDNLQAAIDGANCGDRLELQNGAVFAGNFRFPEKPCDDGHWITIRTSAPDSSLPGEGTRLKPCFAGVSSLPGRPDFHCSTTQNVLAKLEFNKNNGVGPIIFLSGANHYRFIGLEITRTAGNSVDYALTSVAEGAQANHLIFDRVWMHGTPTDETTRAIAMLGMSNVAVLDSFFTDFHCIAVTGTCTDAQVISDNGGHTPSGAIKIVNNFLEASGQSILFGGGGASATAADIEIRGNHLFKPMNWKPGEPGFVGGASGRPFIVKNLFELKNAQRVLFEGNILENCWGGFSQNGYAILLTPKNQSSHCPLCRVTDVTIRYNRVSNVGSVLQIANVADDNGGFATAGERYSIHDLLAENVHGNQNQFQGAGLFAQLISISPPLRDVQIEHSTAFVPRATFAIMTRETKLANFKIDNNLLSTGQYSIISSGGGAKNCANQPQMQGPSGVVKSCFENSTFTHNLLIGDGGWPKDNWSVKDAHAAGIIESSTPGKPYELCAENSGKDCKKSSPARHAGTDGKDLGVDLETLQQKLADVE